MASDVANNLRDRRQKAWHEAKELLDRTSTENRDFTGEEEGKWSALNKEIDSIDERLKAVLDAESRSKETDEVYNRLAGRKAEGVAAYDQAREEIRQWMINPSRGAIEINRRQKGAVSPSYLMSTEFRTLLTSGSPSSTVPVDFYDQLISFLIEVSGLLQTGPSVLNTQGGETVQIPVVASHMVGATAAQGTAIPVSDAGFSQATLSAIKFGALTQLSRELIDDTAVDLLGYLAMSAGRGIGNALGTALVNGTGGITGGVLSGVSVGTTGTVTGVSGAATYSNLVDLEYSVIAPYRQSRSCYWLAADKTIGGFRKIVDGNSRPVWEPSAVLGAPDLLLGKPLVADPFMPQGAANLKTIAFGDFSQYFVRLAGGLRFERSDDFAFGSDLVTFRCLLRADGNWGDTHAVKLYQGAAS